MSYDLGLTEKRVKPLQGCFLFFSTSITLVFDNMFSIKSFKWLKIDNFSVLPGSENKLLKGLKLGCHGIITATCNVTATLSRKVYDDFVQNKEQSVNEKLCNVRNIFEEYNLISAIHTFMSQEDRYYGHILPPLRILNDKESQKLLEDLKKLNFIYKISKVD